MLYSQHVYRIPRHGSFVASSRGWRYNQCRIPFLSSPIMLGLLPLRFEETSSCSHCPGTEESCLFQAWPYPMDQQRTQKEFSSRQVGCDFSLSSQQGPPCLSVRVEMTEYCSFFDFYFLNLIQLCRFEAGREPF